MRKGFLIIGLVILVANVFINNLLANSELNQALQDTLAAEDTVENLKQARIAYDKGEYAQAVVYYKNILEQEVVSGELYYNLGNAEFKLGNIGKAIYYYRRALKLSPWDKDIRFNLAYARKLTSRPQDKRDPLEKWISDFFNRFSGQNIAVLTLFLYLVVIILAGISIIKGRENPSWAWLTGLVGTIFFLLAVWTTVRIIVERSVRWGVVVKQQIEVRNGPGKDYQVGFTVPEGREVRLFSQEGKWVSIGLPQEGHKGWVVNSDIWLLE